MAIQQTLTTSFKQDMLQAGQNLVTNTLKMALYTGFATIGPTTTVYAITNEVAGTGYTAGGNAITGAVITADADGTVYVTFNSVVWPAASFTARGALIYNVTQGNKSIAVLDFGSDKVRNNQTFTVTMPSNTATTALLRF